MFEGTVLGIDPGTAAVGLAAVATVQGRLRVAWSDTARTPPGLAAGERLRRVYGAVREAIAANAPGAVAIERLMWGRNTGSAMEVSRASGVILLAAADSGVPVEEYAPLEVKMAVTGVGNATKEQLRRCLVRVLNRRQAIDLDELAAEIRESRVAGEAAAQAQLEEQPAGGELGGGEETGEAAE